MKGSVEQIEAGSGVVQMRALVSGGVGLASCVLTSEFCTLNRMLPLFKFQFLHLGMLLLTHLEYQIMHV